MFAEEMPAESQPADLEERFLAFFCNHLVALAINCVPINEKGEDSGEPIFLAFSGFILSVRGSWCLVTAGHAVKELDAKVRDRRIRLAGCYLADYFGTDPIVKEPTPFGYEDAPRFFIDDDAAGLDFALIALRLFYRESLMANGIRAISEENWIRQHNVEFERYALLGLPECLVPNARQLELYENRTAGRVHPVLMTVTPVELPPEESPRFTFPWFTGRVGAAGKVPSIKGMSGGPIFGFAKDEDGRLRYWIVAVQSQWRERSRTIFGCPVTVFAALVEEMLQTHEVEEAVGEGRQP